MQFMGKKPTPEFFKSRLKSISTSIKGFVKSEQLESTPPRKTSTKGIIFDNSLTLPHLGRKQQQGWHSCRQRNTLLYFSI